MVQGKNRQIADLPSKSRIKIHVKFRQHLAEFLDFSVDMFGAGVSRRVYEEITARIAALAVMPDANPKAKYIDSTPGKTYRNIIVKSIIITYSMTPGTVTVLDLRHKSMSPMKK